MSQASEKAIALIVGFEVTSKAAYERLYQGPIWPGGASGVTIGIGYDIGYCSAARLQTDWHDNLPADMVAALSEAIGVTGTPASALAHELASTVSVPWAAANAVFRSRDVPSYSKDTRNALVNTDALSPDSFGALLSLVFNRGASFGAMGDRYREMRAIKHHMTDRAFALIPDEVRSMKRLWPTVKGLRDRRDTEAALFESGLR